MILVIINKSRGEGRAMQTGAVPWDLYIQKTLKALHQSSFIGPPESFWGTSSRLIELALFPNQNGVSEKIADKFTCINSPVSLPAMSPLPQ